MRSNVFTLVQTCRGPAAILPCSVYPATRASRRQQETSHAMSPQLDYGAQMRNFRVCITSFLTTLLVALLAGCGQEVVNVPSVVSTTPTAGATSVVINTTITAIFSMAMNPSTLTATTFTVSDPSGAAVAGSVTYSGTTATFTPSAVLVYGSVYTATITTGIKPQAELRCFPTMCGVLQPLLQRPRSLPRPL